MICPCSRSCAKRASSRVTSRPTAAPLFAAYDEQRVAHLLRDSLRVQPEDYEAMNVCLREQAQAAAEACWNRG